MSEKNITDSKESCLQQKGSITNSIICEVALGLLASVIPAVFAVWSMIEILDIFELKGLLIFLINVALLAIIIYVAVDYIRHNVKKLKEINAQYQSLISEEEKIELKKTKRRNGIIAIVSIIVILALIITPIVSFNLNLSKGYKEAVAIFENGSYEEAENAFKKLPKDDYNDTKSYVSLCEAHIAYDNGEIKKAYFETIDLCFKDVIDEQAKAIADFKEKVKAEYDSYSKAEEKEQTNVKKYYRIPTTTKSYSYTFKNKTNQKKDDDPYNVNDYSNEEDFYDDNYDSFFDYYEAEDYYKEHHE
ncbi:MAG: hypothetical protein MJ147_06485 [Clostridia bacterium]|nr:hypothetical protein [Clostridia bacterium]